jgi:hypothetical protein
MTVGGQVGKFVVDDEAGTIRLPKIIMPIQGLTDLSKLGEIVEAGLPNITGSITGAHSGQGIFRTTSGAFTLSSGPTQWGAGGQSAENTNNNYRQANFDASKSNPIYGKTNTVQQEQIQYPYFIQVATGAEVEDNIINEIELNNPYSFGDSKYSPVALNNLSWLKSEGQYNSKAVYPAYYEWLLKIYNGVEVVDGVSVKLTTEEYTDYDWVLNTAEETFRLPLLDGSEDIVSDKYDELELLASGTTYTAPANGWYSLHKASGATGKIIVVTNTKTGIGSSVTSSGTSQILRADAQVKKGQIAYVAYDATGATKVFRFIYAKGNGNLYFYVGDVAQNPNIINAGRIEEKIASLIPDNSSLISSYGMPSDKYIDLAFGASGTTYIAPANGWFCAMAVTNNANNSLSLSLNGNPQESRVVVNSNVNTTNRSLICLLPVKKGDVVHLNYVGITTTYGTYTNLGISFIYAEGEQ